MLPEELIGQAIKEVTMHEVGHTLGLRHNFKASTMLKNEQLHDTDDHPQARGWSARVMDYAPVNLAPKGVKQGDYFTTTLGPYDYWAIEYAYKPLAGGTEGEAEELKKIATQVRRRRATTTAPTRTCTARPTRSSTSGTSGADPMKFGQDRILLAEELLEDAGRQGGRQGRGLPADAAWRSPCC